MKLKQSILYFVCYTLIIFAANYFFLSPEKPVAKNLLNAAIAGVLFIVLLAMYRYILKRRASR